MGWVVGFVDGEGCFTVSIFRNTTTKTGWQVFPEFVVTQGARSRHVLEELRDYFGCGHISVNHRHDNHNEPLYRYCVRSMVHLRGKIIPFFERNPLRTAKVEDFRIFRQILEHMERGEHLHPAGINTIAGMAECMNRKAVRTRILRDSTPDPPQLLKDVGGKIESDLHGDMQSAAETTAPPA